MLKRFIVTLYILIALVVISALLYDYIKFHYYKTENSQVLGSSEPSKDVFGNIAKAVYWEPVSLKIESVGINLDVIPVGIEDDGVLEAPIDWNVAGWYKDGAKSGEPGNLIIDGHYDTNTGVLAAFGLLKNVKKDDNVVVFDRLGTQYIYKVNEIFYVDINDPEKLQVLEEDKYNPTITLITCGGVWLPTEGTYSKRLVVKGNFVNSE